MRQENGAPEESANQGRPLCRHCGKAGPIHARGLCHRCHRDPAIRGCYPTAPRRFYGRGVPDSNGTRPLPRESTAAEPGSPAKLHILEGRAARREQLFHPEDARAAGRRGGRRDPDEPGGRLVRALLDRGLWPAD